MYKSIKLAIVFFSLLSVSGCIRMILPTSEAELVNKGQSIEIVADTDFITAFSRLKPYAQKCIAYYTPNGFVDVTSNLDRNNSTATLTGHSNFGTYTFHTILTPTHDGKTTIKFINSKSLTNAQKFLNSRAKTFQWVAENYTEGDSCKIAQ